MSFPCFCDSRPLYSDPTERAHFWLPDSELTTTHELLDTPTSERMYIDQNEVIRVRVEADEFYDDEPGPRKMSEGKQVPMEARRAPYSVVVSISSSLLTLGCFANPHVQCSIAEQGLGPVSWWNGAQAEDEEAMDEG